jgi:hypothetical protein
VVSQVVPTQAPVVVEHVALIWQMLPTVLHYSQLLSALQNIPVMVHAEVSVAVHCPKFSQAPVMVLHDWVSLSQLLSWVAVHWLL